jgi:hypothetical protein
MKSLRPHAMRLFLLAALLLLPVLVITLGHSQQVRAYSDYLTELENLYPGIIGSRIDNCEICHDPYFGLTSFALDYTNGYSFTAIEQLDSDLDGYSNIVEINALTYPGNANDYPGAQPTSTPTSTALPPTPTPTEIATVTVTPTSTATPTIPPPAPTPTLVPLQPPAKRLAFLGTVVSFPGSSSQIGVWEINDRKVYVSAATWIEGAGLLHTHSQVWALGYRRNDGSVSAVYIRVLTSGDHESSGGKATSESQGSSDQKPSAGVARVSGASAMPAGNR